MPKLLAIGLIWGVATTGAAADDTTPRDESKSRMTAETFAGLKLRALGPALTSGRVVDFAVDPRNRARYFVAVCSGGLWKTVNNGTTFEPVFDGEGSYSIGCVTLDPQRPARRLGRHGREQLPAVSVSFGDGVYKSVDGGKQLEERRPQGLRAHRHDRGRPA
jgi:hypothetical protein